MSGDNEYLNGLIFKHKHEKAPDYVIAKVSIKRLELIESLQAREGEWINLDLKESQAGKLHAPIDNWKPNSEGGNAARTQRQERSGPRKDEFTDNGRQSAPATPFIDDDIPF